MPKNSRVSTQAEHPLLPDELAAMADIAPAKEVPETVAAALATPRLYIHGDTEPPRAKKIAREGSSKRSAWSLDLARGSVLGRPGLSAERLKRAAHKLADATHTRGMRPAWAGQSFQSRRTSDSFVHVPQQRIKGSQVEPYYGVYPPDQRQVYLPNSYPWRCIGRIFTWTNWAGGGGWQWWVPAFLWDLVTF